MMNLELFGTFVGLNIINVIIQTVKSICTVKCGKGVAALVNALAYGLYTIVTIYMLCDLDLWVKAGVVALCNLIAPIYQGVPRNVVAAMLPTVFLPFNLVKGGMNMAATLLLYKPVVTALRKAGLVAPSKSNGQGKKLNPGFRLFSLALLATFATCALVLMGVI